jgi:hypothetical protein
VLLQAQLEVLERKAAGETKSKKKHRAAWDKSIVTPLLAQPEPGEHMGKHTHCNAHMCVRCKQNAAARLDPLNAALPGQLSWGFGGNVALPEQLGGNGHDLRPGTAPAVLAALPTRDRLPPAHTIGPTTSLDSIGGAERKDRDRQLDAGAEMEMDCESSSDDEAELKMFTSTGTLIREHNYFGDGARQHFFGTFHKLSHQRRYFSEWETVSGTDTSLVKRPATADASLAGGERVGGSLPQLPPLDLSRSLHPPTPALDESGFDEDGRWHDEDREKRWADSESDEEEMARPGHSHGGRSHDHAAHKQRVGVFAESAITPRQHFLKLCIERDLTPHVQMIVRRLENPVINLAHFGLGDALACVLAEVLCELPCVEVLNLRDNALHDEGITAIMKACHHKPDIHTLDLSENDIDGEAADSLLHFLSLPQCPLIELHIERADVDDLEVKRIVQALHGNKLLQVLDLSHNIIGGKEALNTVQPDFVTGGEAIAELLSMNHPALTTIDLSWNLIRRESAQAIAHALATNHTLTELDIAFNACGDGGGQAFGNALAKNKTLKTLDLSYNSIAEKGTKVLAFALIENYSLSNLKLEGNPVGAEGGRAMVKLMNHPVDDRLCKDPLFRRHINLKNAAFFEQKREKKEKMFDPAEPTGHYHLDMTDPYEHAICGEMLDLAAHEPGCKFLSLVWHKDARPKGLGKNVKLVKRDLWDVLEQTEEELDDEARALFILLDVADDGEIPLEAVVDAIMGKEPEPDLNKAIDEKEEERAEKEKAEAKAEAKAKELEKKGKGKGRRRSLGKGFRPMCSREELRQMVHGHDVDFSGALSEAEFIHCSLLVHAQAKAARGQNHNEGGMVEESNGSLWTVPEGGWITCEFHKSFVPPSMLQIESKENFAKFLSEIKDQSTDHGEMVHLVGHMEGMCLTVDQAIELMKQSGGDAHRTGQVAELLDRMPDTMSSRMLVRTYLGVQEQAHLRHEMGQLYRIQVRGTSSAASRFAVLACCGCCGGWVQRARRA